MNEMCCFEDRVNKGTKTNIQVERVLCWGQSTFETKDDFKLKDDMCGEIIEGICTCGEIFVEGFIIKCF